MRLVSIYQLYDEKAQTVIGPIYTSPNPVAVARELRAVVNDGQSLLAKHPEDFNLIRLGGQDTDTGLIAPLDTPELVFKLTELVEKPKDGQPQPAQLSG